MNKIDVCKKCTNRKFDLKTGIVCNLTNEKPTFEVSCPDFENDETVKEYSGVKLRPNAQRAKTAVLLIWIVLFLDVMSLFSSGLQYNLLSVVSNGGEISFEEANANDLREQAIAIIYLLAYIVSGITFIMWFRRAYFNLHQKVNYLTYNEGWAAGSWFVPILNLFRPFQIMKELYVETKKVLTSKDHLADFELTTNFLGIWWTLWIINNIIGQIISRTTKYADTVPELLTITVLDIINSVVGIGLALVTIRVIKDYSKTEELLIKQE